MEEILKIVIGIFAALGILAVTALLLYLIASALKKYKTKDKTPLFPGKEYMDKIGGPCPSGWVYLGKQQSENGSHTVDICHNRFNVPVCNEDKCYNSVDKTKKLAAFPVVTDWDAFIKGDVYNSSRCQWVRDCGPPSEIEGSSGCNNTPPASWIGLDDKC
jgi:hypothetical protein